MHGMLAASIMSYYCILWLLCNEQSPKQMSPSVSDLSCEVKQCCHFFTIQFSSSESQNSNAAQVSPFNDVYSTCIYFIYYHGIKD